MRPSLIYAAAAGLLVFAAVALAMSAGATDGMDKLLLMAFRPAALPGELIGGPLLLTAMVGLTSLGGTLVLTLLSVAVGAGYWRDGAA